MRVIAPETEIPETRTTRNRPLNIELVGLAIATTVAIGGIGLAYAAKMARLDEAASSGGLIRLHALHSPAELEPALTMFESAYERSAVRTRAVRARDGRAAARPCRRVGRRHDVRRSRSRRRPARSTQREAGRACGRERRRVVAGRHRRAQAAAGRSAASSDIHDAVRPMRSPSSCWRSGSRTWFAAGPRAATTTRCCCRR